MPHWRPLATATSATVIAAMLAVGITGGHSPFAAAAPAQQPVANQVADEIATPGSDVSPADDGASPSPDGTPTAAPTAGPTARPASASRGGAAPSTGGSGSASSGGSTTTPTAKPTPKPTRKPVPTAAPTERPDPTPTQAAQAGTLRVSDSDAGPRLTWTQCSAPNFAAYAVVRSLDSEIHYPAEDLDTVVARITSAATTSLTDTGAPNSRVYYAVWCVYRSDGEDKTIWKTPVVRYQP